MIPAGEEFCDKNWVASNNKNCKKYLDNKYCQRGTERGGSSHYGLRWKWGDFDVYATKKNVLTLPQRKMEITEPGAQPVRECQS